jgi:hypothetical protein
MHIDPKTKKVKLTDAEVTKLENAKEVMDALIMVNYDKAAGAEASYVELLNAVHDNQASFPAPLPRAKKTAAAAT